MSARSPATGAWGSATETATATVFFAGDYAAKLKKPFDFGYVDFRSREARRCACEREIDLNRRLSPDVYLGVVDLVDANGMVLDHLVLMRRLPEDRRLARLLQTAAGSDLEQCVLPAIARLLADFHSGAPIVTDPESPGSHEAVRRLWVDGVRALDPIAHAVVSDSIRHRIETLAATYLRGRRRLFDERLRDGWVRDGHGDLLADDIFVLDDGPRILDCLEFDDGLRMCDIWMDVASLAADLERLGHAELATAFLDRYAEFSGHSAPSSLRHFFIAYRALVRAKVAAIRFDQGDVRAPAEARRLAEICLDHLRRATVTLTLVGGLPGSGKTTLAGGLAAALDAAHLSSDVIRKEMHGLPICAPHPEPWEAGLYDADATRGTYAELLRRAQVALERGQSVVLDATWRDETLRETARDLGRRTAAVVTELCCAADAAVSEDRLHARRAGSSDADVAVLRRIRTEFDRWSCAGVIRTDNEVPASETALARVRQSMQALEGAASGLKPLGSHRAGANHRQ